jgi:hypothetical protein
VLGAVAQAIHPTDPDSPAALAEYVRASQPVHVLLFFAVLLVLLGLPSVYARQSRKVGLLGAVGFVFLFFGVSLLDLVHSILEFTLLPTLVAQLPEQIMSIFTAADEDPIFSSLMMISEPMLLLGVVGLAISTIRARVLFAWPAWLLLLDAITIVITTFFIDIPSPGVEYTAILFYLGLAGLGLALLTDQAARATAVNQ